MPSELKPCPICGSELKVHGPESWKPTFYDPDSGGDPYTAVCDCGFHFQSNHYDFEEFVKALNRRVHPKNEATTCEGCENQKRNPKRGAFSHEACIRCRRHWSDHYRSTEGGQRQTTICPKCNSTAPYDPYFGKRLCRQCGWSEGGQNDER